jgi:hypothetical protein
MTDYGLPELARRYKDRADANAMTVDHLLLLAQEAMAALEAGNLPEVKALFAKMLEERSV